MKRLIQKLIPAILLPVVLLASACGPDGSKTPPSAPTDQNPADRQAQFNAAMAECGPDCVPVVFQVKLQDENDQDVPVSEGWHVEVEWDMLAIPTGGGDPIHIPIHDWTTGIEAATPYTYDAVVPFNDTKIVGPHVIQMSITVIATSVPAGWSLACRSTEYGVEHSSDRATNMSGLAGVVGLPEDLEVFCSFPVDIDPPLLWHERPHKG